MMIKDVIYFNNEIEKIRYTLKVSNPKAFIKSLNKSAVAIESMNLDSTTNPYNSLLLKLIKTLIPFCTSFKEQ